MPDILTIATSQFPVGRDVDSNLRHILRHIRDAAARKADLVHFCETSLSGYPGVDYPEIEKEEENLLLRSLSRIRDEAGRQGVWAIVGSHHFENGLIKPYNCLYVINKNGEIAARYDKRLLTDYGQEREVDHYSPGDYPVVFNIKNIPCGMLICHEWRYPELYREYYRMGTRIIFQSWYDGGQSTQDYTSGGKQLGEIIMGTARGYAANNHLWISGSNTSRRQSAFPVFMIRPDGQVTGKLRRNRAGMLITRVDPGQSFKDPSSPNRDRLIRTSYKNCNQYFF